MSDGKKPSAKEQLLARAAALADAEPAPAGGLPDVSWWYESLARFSPELAAERAAERAILMEPSPYKA